ncbi:PLP-dependent aminotransferase family protein [Massilia sp. LXY-6]|uniref:aminotransferase-like domain-containing protein n=1 Tax=Massilia sp. LXY-6 TaxID=3379823 RepID=UPI003EE341E2
MHVHEILAAVPLDRSAATPLFRQLYLRMKEAILAGDIGACARLPATRELGRLLKVSRQTVLAAYEQLMAEGYLEGTVGKGSFVSASLPAAVSRVVREESAAPLVRPLSARGEALAGTMARVRHHDGPLRTFRISMPGLDLFPFEVWRKLEARHWRRREVPLGYGGAAGHAPLRELLCAYLKASRGVRCVPEQIVVTAGAQQALYLLAQLLLAPGEGVWLESPGYQGALAPFAVAGARICTGCVIYVGTLSKVLFPGLRLGYIVAPPGLAEPLARAKAVVDRHSPIVPQAVLADFIQEGHFARHIRRTRDAYGERRVALLEALRQRLDGVLACGPSDAGLDVCVGVTNGLGELDAAARAAAAGVDVRTLSYYTNPGAGPDCAMPPGLLLGFSAFTPEQIRAGVARLAQALIR